MKTLQFVRATTADIEDIINNRIDFLTEYLGPQTEETLIPFREHTRLYLQEALPAQQYIVFFAKDGDEIVGAGGLTVRHNPGNFKNPGGKSGYIMSMYTKASHRKMGIATTILNHLINTAKAQGIIMFELHATEDGEPVYKKYGFNLHPEPTYRKWI